MDYPAVAAYAVAVFLCPITTVFIEALFSGMVFNKSKHRAPLTDDTVIDLLTVRELVEVCGEVYNQAPEPGLSLDTSSVLEDKIKF